MRRLTLRAAVLAFALFVGMFASAAGAAPAKMPANCTFSNGATTCGTAADPVITSTEVSAPNAQTGCVTTLEYTATTTYFMSHRGAFNSNGVAVDGTTATVAQNPPTVVDVSCPWAFTPLRNAKDVQGAGTAFDNAYTNAVPNAVGSVTITPLAAGGYSVTFAGTNLLGTTNQPAGTCYRFFSVAATGTNYQNLGTAISDVSGAVSYTTTVPSLVHMAHVSINVCASPGYAILMGSFGPFPTS